LVAERRKDLEADAYLEECQSLTHYRSEGGTYARVRYGRETFRDPAEASRAPCRHCGAVKGQLHEPLCDYEQCPVCGEQVMSCDCGILTEHAVHASKTSFQLLAVTIVCTDLARSVRFYEQALGAVREADDGSGCPWLMLGSVSITLLDGPGAVSPAKFPEHPMAVLWVETDDLAIAARRFARFGVKVLKPPDGQSMTIADPDGIVIEVWQAAPEGSVGNAAKDQSGGKLN
jgi:catechol 2,3-dioxygenase-like lactoylglutathione lyase family enzyme